MLHVLHLRTMIDIVVISSCPLLLPKKLAFEINYKSFSKYSKERYNIKIESTTYCNILPNFLPFRPSVMWCFTGTTKNRMLSWLISNRRTKNIAHKHLKKSQWTQGKNILTCFKKLRFSNFKENNNYKPFKFFEFHEQFMSGIFDEINPIGETGSIRKFIIPL